MISRICTKKGIGSILIAAGIICVVAALVLLIWNINEAKRAEKSVSYILPQLVEEIADSPPTDAEPSQEENNEADTDANTSVSVDGENYIGVLSIPSLDLELPIMAEWSYPRLKIAPCRYTGSAQTGNLVIAAHNYAKHFGMLTSLEKGNKVYFTDAENRIYTYEVEKVEVLEPTAIEEMTSGVYDLTLFTCTYGGKSRVTVRCMSVAEEDF